jgi:hypothetical protein
VFGIDDVGDRHGQMQAALQRYTRAIVHHHREDQVISAADGRG